MIGPPRVNVRVGDRYIHPIYASGICNELLAVPEQGLTPLSLGLQLDLQLANHFA